MLNPDFKFLVPFSPTPDFSGTDRAVCHSGLSGSAALCCSGLARTQNILGKEWSPNAQPSGQIHRPAIRRADHREG